MSWGGSLNEVSRKLELKLINPVQDSNIKPVILELGQLVYLYDKTKELFRGYVIDREANSQNGSISYVCYDMLYFLTKSKLTHNFGTSTAEAITKKICSDYDIPTGAIQSTGVSQSLKIVNGTLYDAIMKAYTQASVQTKSKYFVSARGGKLLVEQVGYRKGTAKLSEGSNILSSKYTETLSSMINRVKIYDSEGTQIDEVTSDRDLKYGLFQETYTEEKDKDAVTQAKAKLHGIDKTFSLECINDNEVRAGYEVHIYDDTTGINGVAYVNSDTHTYENGVARMSLVVTLDKIMDAKEA
jgi:hypothetical protein